MTDAEPHERDAGVDTDPLPEGGRHETPLERVDRNLLELLQELRVALPGVQVLFAFLLIVPFSFRFDRLSGFEQRLYFATLLLTALASALLIAPTMYHRIQFRRHDKEHIVVVSNRFAIAGLGALALGMTGAIMLITHVMFGTTATVVFTAVTAGVFIVLWYALPLARRARQS